jgi:hypothetical protein
VLPADVSRATGNDANFEVVLRPFVIARDLRRTNRGARIIDFYPLGWSRRARGFRVYSNGCWIA